MAFFGKKQERTVTIEGSEGPQSTRNSMANPTPMNKKSTEAVQESKEVGKMKPGDYVLHVFIENVKEIQTAEDDSKIEVIAKA